MEKPCLLGQGAIGIVTVESLLWYSGFGRKILGKNLSFAEESCWATKLPTICIIHLSIL